VYFPNSSLRPTLIRGLNVEFRAAGVVGDPIGTVIGIDDGTDGGVDDGKG